MILILKLAAFSLILSLLRQRQFSHQPFIQEAYLSSFIQKMRIIFVQPESRDQIKPGQLFFRKPSRTY